MAAAAAGGGDGGVAAAAAATAAAGDVAQGYGVLRGGADIDNVDGSGGGIGVSRLALVTSSALASGDW